MVVLRLLFLVVFVGLTRAEEERANQIKINGVNVYRNAFYSNTTWNRISCHPPKETNGKYEGLAIFKGNASNPNEVPKTPLCAVSGGKPSATCSFHSDPTPELSVDVQEDGYYICKYEKDPEPPVTQAVVSLYSRSDQMTVYRDGAVINGQNLQVTNESAYSFICPKSDMADTKVEWYRNEHHLKLDHNPHYALNDTNHNLTFLSKGPKTIDGSKYGGWYRCETIGKDGAKLATAFVKVNSGAYASAAQKSYNKMEGEKVTMSCDIEGEPVPDVKWRKGDKELDKDPELSKRITYSPYKGIPHASVTIRDLAAEDYGDYVCVASRRDDGSFAESTTLLRVRSKLAALWPFLGIVAEVIVLVAIIFIYEKRRAKKEQEENEDTADQKKSLTASNNENKDVRQRKA